VSNSQTHPTDRELDDYHSGRLPAAERDAIQSHVARCGQCEAHLNTTPFEAEEQAGTAAYVPTKSLDSLQFSGLENHPRYRVIKYLGNGAMGQVYLAEHALMDRRVAIKVIRTHLLDNPDAVARFRGEVKIAAKLDHPNIVRAYDAEELDGAHLFVMEYVSGASLQVVLKKKGPLPVLHACAYMRAAALGLQHAFEKGTVHRDVKPGNIMLSRTGQIKLCDFGLAKVAREQQSASLSFSATGLAQLLGTPAFLAPEQAVNARAADIRADIYSLGCTMFHLLTGRTPFKADSILDIVQMHCSEPRPRVSAFRADVPEAVADLIVRMMSIDKADRPQTPKQVADALLPFCREPIVHDAIPVDPSELSDAPDAPAGKVASPGPSIAGSVESAMRYATRLPERLELPARTKPIEAKADTGDEAVETVEIPDRTPDTPRVRKKSRKAARKRRADWIRYAVFGGIAVMLAIGLASLLGKTRTPRPQPVAEKPPIPAEKPTTTPREPAPERDDGGFRPLFNGRDLTGWTQQTFPGSPPAQWSVENGEIATRGGFGNLVTTRADFRDFHLRMEVKIDEGDSGVIFRYRTDSEKPSGYYQAQITPDTHPGLRLGTLSGHSAKGARFFPGVDSLGDLKGQWVKLELFVEAGTIRLLVNGRETVKTRMFVPDADIGGFALETYGANTKARFRNIEVRALPDTPPRPETFVSLLNGKDLTGWLPGPMVSDWKFENGLLRMPVGGKPGSIVHEAVDYRDFHLRCEWRFTGSVAQVEFRTNAAAERDAGYAAHLGPNARLTDLATKKSTQFAPPATLELKQGEWYTWDIIVRDREIRILLEGVELLKYEEPAGDKLVFGRLAIYAPGNTKGGTVARMTSIRKIEICRLS
jgi:serine/threonine protein kinase